MSHDDKVDGARNAFTIYFAYISRVAQEIGHERALELASQVEQAVGEMAGRHIKDHAGDAPFDLSAAAEAAMKSIRDDMGIMSEVVEVKPDRIVVECERCPVYEAAEFTGMDPKLIEAQCRDGSIRYMQALVHQLNPDLKYELREFRTGADGRCVEAITIR